MNYLQYVNIKQGTESKSRYSNGNTLPLTQLPFAMCGFAPQTENNGGWFYHPNDRSLEGVRLTHQPSPWIGDYGTFLFAPQTDRIYDNAATGWSGYRPEEAILSPVYIKLRFLRSKTDFELTPTERGCKIRLKYPNERTPFLSFFPVMGNYNYEIDYENNILKATTDGCRGDFTVNFKNHLIVRFNSPIDKSKTYFGENSSVHIAFTDKNIDADMATSYISFEQAYENLRQDCDGKDFDTVLINGTKQWEEYLHRIEVECENEKQFKTFYSCLWRTGTFPHKCYEININWKKIHYSPFDGKIHDGLRYTDNGFWDTYRAEFPLLAIIAKKEYAEILEGFIADYVDGGWLPRWPSIGERGCMPSTLIDAVIADAAVKGIVGKEILEIALEGMLKHANTDSGHWDLGRYGAETYLKYGYMPKDIIQKDCVNLTLDSAYGDYCIAQVAKCLGKENIYREYLIRSENYKNIFDKETGFMRGKYTDGSFDKNFDSFNWGGDYTEGSAWQSSFAVPHDIDGLAELYGGKNKMIEKLDELFATPPYYNVGGYNCEIHEMTEMAAVDFGQCAISNQPSFHLPYLFAELGDIAKTEYWVKKLCEEAFTPENDGFPGDEDNGTMAAWYVLSNLGIYDICPGKNKYTKIKPLVKSAKILGKEIL